MTKEIATVESLRAIAELGKQLTKIYNGYAKISGEAPKEILEKMQLNNLGTIRERMKEVLERSRANSGLFANWKAEIESIHAALEATRAPTKKKGA